MTAVKYKKPEAVKELEAMADAEARRLHPTMRPEHIAPRKYRDDGANSLTGCIVKYITLKGGFASRISNQGTYSRKLEKYIPSTAKKGLPDVMATYKGLSLHIEVKYNRDRMSEAQQRVQADVTRSGRLYYVAHSFTEFKTWFDML